MNNGKICVSVAAANAEDFIAKITQAGQYADVIELRLDTLSTSEVDLGDKASRRQFYARLASVKSDRPWLVTYRPREQGGDRDISIAERREFWSDPPPAEYYDLEEDVIGETSIETGRICSFHDFDGVPADIDTVFDRLAATGADIVKIAASVNDITDTIGIWKLLERARSARKMVIPIAMGDAGKWTRIMGPAHGAFLSYASLETGGETAPGQVTARDLAEVYRVNDLNNETQVFGVIGDPIAQSISPYMHNPAFAATGRNAVFVSLLVKQIDEFMRRMVKPETREVELNFGGFSVTMPHKRSIIPHLDAIDPTAMAIGAVNTVRIDDGKLTGSNTDAHGFISPLKAAFGSLRDVRVAVAGAGGAARAVVYALKEELADVTVFARDAGKAARFAEEFEVGSGPMSGLGTMISEFDILVDTTPLGMKGPFESDSLFTADELAGLKFVFDLVTKSVDTPIIREAKRAGIPTLGGAEMLVAQGIRQFEIWTGGDAPADLMRKAVFDKLRQSQK